LIVVVLFVCLTYTPAAKSDSDVEDQIQL